MACANCPSGTEVLDSTYTVLSEPYSKLSHGDQIPVKVGQPLSSACQRATVIGAIPQVIRYPSFTTANGAVLASAVSNAGISNLNAFFTNKSGCYEDANARLASNCC